MKDIKERAPIILPLKKTTQSELKNIPGGIANGGDTTEEKKSSCEDKETDTTQNETYREK